MTAFFSALLASGTPGSVGGVREAPGVPGDPEMGSRGPSNGVPGDPKTGSRGLQNEDLTDQMRFFTGVMRLETEQMTFGQMTSAR